MYKILWFIKNDLGIRIIL